MDERFVPPWYLKSAMLQTFLNSFFLRKSGKGDMERSAVEMIIEAGDGVRLQGFHSAKEGPRRGMAILLHGWEGSAASAYIVNTGRFLFRNGFDIFRLNLRDHGGSHHLNEGLFYGTLIEEAHAAVKSAARLSGGNPVLLLGFSMGGNFALRIAGKHIADPVPHLQMVMAVNPALDPLRATENIDRIGIIRRYFINKWKRSLRRKQELFPALYDFKKELSMKTCMEMTESLIRRYSDYRDARHYFKGYTLTEGWLDRIEIPTQVIMSGDDPFIPADDFETTLMGPGVHVLMQNFGGHCGYIDGIRLGSWYQPLAVRLFGDII